MADPQFTDLVVQMPRDFQAKAKARAKAQGMTLSRYVRKLIAADLRIDPPEYDRELDIPKPKPYRKPGWHRPDWKRINKFLEQQSKK